MYGEAGRGNTSTQKILISAQLLEGHCIAKSKNIYSENQQLNLKPYRYPKPRMVTFNQEELCALRRKTQPPDPPAPSPAEPYPPRTAPPADSPAPNASSSKENYTPLASPPPGLPLRCGSRPNWSPKSPPSAPG